MQNAEIMIGNKGGDDGALLRNKLQSQIVRVLGKNMPPDRMLALALREVSKSNALMKCSALSVCASIIEAAILGLEISSVTGQAYLIPFKQTCQLIVGYKGLVLLAWRDAKIITHADLIREADAYDIIRGSEPKIIHRPALNVDRGEVVGAYAVFTYPDGRTIQVFHDLMELERRRLRSKARSDGPWVTDKNAMQMKCPIRDGASKFIPFDTAPQLVRAAARDELRESGIGGYIDPEVAQTAGEITGEDPEQLNSENTESDDGNGQKGVESLKQRLQAKGNTQAVADNNPSRLITESECKRMLDLAELRGWKGKQLTEMLKGSYEVTKYQDLTLAQYNDFMRVIQTPKE